MLDGDLFLRDTTVRDNISNGSGGGLFQSGNGRLSITGSLIATTSPRVRPRGAAASAMTAPAT